MPKCLEQIFATEHVVSFLGHDFSLGFIPVGQSIPLIQQYQDMLAIEKDPKTTIETILKSKVHLIA